MRRRHLWVLRDHFGTYLDVVGDAPAVGDEERIEVSVAAHTARSLAEQLAGWGSMIEVVGPEDVRHELARIGTELAAAYG
ncbi:WYL domain-containing protein [Nocardioides sp. NPDC127503]|uniref:WYL domain-containing protein n=1 Tax=Nocardioides sp. NPDC127503 TaxID=3154516 RepID=UPI0033205CA4